MEHVPLSLSRASPPPARLLAESGADVEPTAVVPPARSANHASASSNQVATLEPPPTLEESIHQASSRAGGEERPVLRPVARQALESAGDPVASSASGPPPNGDENDEAGAEALRGSSSRRRVREPDDGDSNESDLGSLHASAKRFRQTSAPEDDFGGPISVQRNDGLYTTTNNPYVMPDLDILAPYWSTAARSALRGRVTGLMRFFRLAGYLPPTAPSDQNPDDSQRRRLRVSRGYETWKCRACGVMLNPVCGETGNARKHISLKKCGGLFAPLEEALLLDRDEEVRKVLIDSGARVAVTEPGPSGSQTNGSTSAFPLGSHSIASTQEPLQSGAQPLFASVGTTGEVPSIVSPSVIGSRQDFSSARPQTGAVLTRPIFQQQLDGTTTLIGWTAPESSTSSASNARGPKAQNEPVPPLILPPPGQQEVSSSFKAPSALAIASYFLVIGQPAEHADSVAWRHLFDGLPGMPTVQEIREALQGSVQ